MAVARDTIWERFLKPIFQLVIDEEALLELYKSIDWEAGSDRISCRDLIYPEYYRGQNFHGIQGGYLNADAAVSYDAVTQYVLPPNETWVREGLIEAIAGQPRRILDLGCGTGSTTLMLKRKFPLAEVIGLDLSPYMLVMADYKAQKAGVNIQWCHGKAEETGFEDASFDLVCASLFFHETPPTISQAILRECFRLLMPGGQVIILDGNQKTIRYNPWLTEIFEEPYIQAYAAGSVDAWMGAAGKEAVRTEELWWVHQVTQGLKPMRAGDRSSRNAQEFQGNEVEVDSPEFPAPAF